MISTKRVYFDSKAQNGGPEIRFYVPRMVQYFLTLNAIAVSLSVSISQTALLVEYIIKCLRPWISGRVIIFRILRVFNEVGR